VRAVLATDEDQIVSGDGTGENFTGLLNVAGTQTLAAPVAPASNLDAIRQAITLVRTSARSEPSAVVLNPNDAQNIDLLKPNKFAGPGSYGAGSARLWNVPVIETNAFSAVTALVGDSPRRCCSTDCRCRSRSARSTTNSFATWSPCSARSERALTLFARPAL
jgi:HK97 family phage major capsid protein